MGDLGWGTDDRLPKIKRSLMDAHRDGSAYLDSYVDRVDVMWMVQEIEDLRVRLVDALDR